MEIRLEILAELMSRQYMTEYRHQDDQQLTFQYMRSDGNNHIIMTNEGVPVPVYANSGKFSSTYIITECEDIEKLIYACLEEYRNWREECLQTAASVTSVEQLLNTCVSMLSNPAALFDESLVLTAWAGEMPDSVEGTIWEDVLKRGMSRPEMYPGEEADIIAEALKSGKKSFKWRSDLFRGQEHICCQIYRGDVPAGILGASDLNGFFSEGEELLMEDAASFISLYYGRTAGMHEEKDLNYIERMLKGLHVNEPALQKSMELLHWKKDDDRQVFSMYKGIYNEYASVSFQKRLQEMFPQSLVMIHEDHLVLLADLTADNRNYTEQLEKEFGFRCGASMIFNDLSHLHYAYIQSRIAMNYAEEGRTVYFPEIYSTYILDNAVRMTEAKALCHPKILELYESGDRNDRTLINDLRVYLLCGRNIAETARKLYLHRNTLLYRLQKLDEIFGRKIAELNEEEAFLIQMSCMIIAKQ